MSYILSIIVKEWSKKLLFRSFCFPLLHVICLFNVVVVLMVKYTKNCDCLNSVIFKDVSFDHTNDQSKWSLFRAVALKLAVYLFIHTMGVMFFRIICQKSSPATQDDPSTIKVLNRIIYNHIEQSLAFLALFAYFIFDGSGKYAFI